MRFFFRKMPKPAKEKGIALLIVTIMVAVIAALAADFSYNAQVDLEAAISGRDRLRAEYGGARAALQVGMLLIRAQEQVQQFKNNPMIPKEMADTLSTIDVTEYSHLVLDNLFPDSNNPSEPTRALRVRYEDGKYPIHCSGGLNPSVENQQNAYRLLNRLLMINPYPPTSTFFSEFDGAFRHSGRDGLAISQADVPRWLIDWVDNDGQRFDAISGSSSAMEEFYDRGDVPYVGHNHYMDTIDEMRLVHGIENESVAYLLSQSLTIYGGKDCKISMGGLQPESWPLVAAVLSVSSNNQGTVLDPNTLEVAKQLTYFLKTSWPMMQNMDLKKMFEQFGFSGSSSQESFCPKSTDACPGSSGGIGQPTQALANVSELLCSPMIAKLPELNQSSGALGLIGTPVPSPPTVALHPIPICPGLLGNYLKSPNSGPRQFYRLESEGKIERVPGKKVQVSIDAVWDNTAINSSPLCNDPRCNVGTFAYFRVH